MNMEHTQSGPRISRSYLHAKRRKQTQGFSVWWAGSKITFSCKSKCIKQDGSTVSICLTLCKPSGISVILQCIRKLILYLIPPNISIKHSPYATCLIAHVYMLVYDSTSHCDWRSTKRLYGIQSFFFYRRVFKFLL